MPFRYSKLTDESPSFFFAVILGILENFAILRQYKTRSCGRRRQFGLCEKFSLNPKINLEIKIILPTFVFRKQ